MSDPIVTISNLHKSMDFQSAIAWCKQNKDKLEQTDFGRAILKAIKEGNIRRLRRYWLGA